MTAKRSRKQRRRRVKAYAARTVFVLAIVSVVLLCAFAVTKLVNRFGESSKQADSGDIIEIKKNGTVLGIIEEDFSKDYYDAEGLEAMVGQEIAEYQGISGSDTSVVLKDFHVENGMARVSIAYHSAEDYRSFNNTMLYHGKVSELAGSGISFDRNFLNADNKESGSAAGMASAAADCHAVVLDEKVTVRVPGKILYYSDNVSLTGKKTAVVNGDSTESAVIIYK